MTIIQETIARLYGVDRETLTEYPPHEGGRNRVFRSGHRVFRLSPSADRTLSDFLAETEYVHYLARNGADCVDAVPSQGGRLVEQTDEGYLCAFTLAEGDQIADHGYRYREGAPLSEYFTNTGKALGRIHALSKRYRPVHPRFDFFDKYTSEYFQELLPPCHQALLPAMTALLNRLKALPRTEENYGMVHFDFSDGNYNIDYATGKITAFDFENCRRCFYLYDLANLWVHGVGWIAWERDAGKRKAFMDEYFETIISGYRSETDISDAELARLPLLVDAVLLENIVDEFEVQKAETGGYEEDEEQEDRIQCLLHATPWMGFFAE